MEGDNLHNNLVDVAYTMTIYNFHSRECDWYPSFELYHQFVSNVFNPSNIHVVDFQQSRICPYHSLSKNLHANIWFLPYKFNTSLYNNCHSSRQPLFIVNPHFLPTRNIPLEQKSQSQSTAQRPDPRATVRAARAWAWGRGCQSPSYARCDEGLWPNPKPETIKTW